MLGESERDNSYNAIPSLSMTVAKAKPPFSQTALGTKTFSFTKDVDYR